MYQISPSPQLEYKSLMARIPYRCGIVTLTVTANAIKQVTHTAAAPSSIYKIIPICLEALFRYLQCVCSRYGYEKVTLLCI